MTDVLLGEKTPGDTMPHIPNALPRTQMVTAFPSTVSRSSVEDISLPLVDGNPFLFKRESLVFFCMLGP